MLSASEKYFKDKEHFKGICPYTDKTCKLWLCKVCHIEHRERRYAKKR